MSRKLVSGIMLTLLLIGMLTLAFNIQPVRASGTIYIRADGSIGPPTAPIQRDVARILSEPPATEWNKTYGGESIDLAYSAIQTSDGGYALAGFTRSFGAGPFDARLIKLATATLTSTNVVFVPNASCPHGGTLPTTDPAFAAFSFSTMAWADVNAAKLASYDTVVLLISTSTVPLNSSQQVDLINWVDGGGKLIIYDSETVPSVDYSWLPYPMTTKNPGARGYRSGNITFVENNTLGCTDPGNVTYYIDTTIVPTGGWFDGVGDCNIFVTSDPNWFGDIKAQNCYSFPPSPGYDGTPAGWVHTYAPYGDGLFIYNGFDIDFLASNSVPNATVLYDGNLAKIWLLELQQPWGIHYNLPGTEPALYYDVTIEAYCYTEDAYISVSIAMDGTPTGFNTSHTFTDLNDTHTFTVPSTDSDGHLFIQWSTNEISTTITVTSGGTYTAYYESVLGDFTGSGYPPPSPPDDVIDINDIRYFIDAYKSQYGVPSPPGVDPTICDLTGPGYPPPSSPDGVIDINDIRYFIDLYKAQYE